jgi:hypothetical protein
MPDICNTISTFGGAELAVRSRAFADMGAEPQVAFDQRRQPAQRALLRIDRFLGMRSSSDVRCGSACVRHASGARA